MECLHDAPLYQYSGAEDVKLDWGKLKTARDNYVVRLNGIYGRGLDGADITTLTGLASFGDDGPEVMVELVDGKKVVTTTDGATLGPFDEVLMAVGRKPLYGEANVKVWTSTFVNLWYGPMPIDPSDKPKTAMKLVTAGSNELVVGLHVIGLGADEMLQGFGVAMKMGATKADFDSCIALHPTAAEEFVTLRALGPGRRRQDGRPLGGPDARAPLGRRGGARAK
ncbi:glutathione-disulfide reductase [Aureococcus anophagefferens]|uniref:Glutathione-disulfide reductase n=1 Tax=Aureococcus anophagefferens TaxID=44056 RepID=A0ABR1GCK0_AURAN